MLFDLQSGKRRRVVQIVFGGLAVIFAVSFVFFGVGSDAGFNPFADGGIGGGGGGDDPFQEDIDNAEERLQTNPRDTAALVELVGLRYQSGTRQLEVDETTGTTALTSESEEQFQRAADAWDRYLKITKGQNVDTSAALLAVQTFATLGQGLINQASQGTGQTALDDADDAIAAFKDAGEAQLRVAKEPSASELARAAEYFYLGGDSAAGDEAGQRALAAAANPKQREQVQKALDASKQQGEQLNAQIDAFRKQLKQAGGGTGGEDNPLGDLGGGLGGSGGSLSTP
jgi:hypothetical protein